MRYGLLAFFAMVWMVAAVITGAVTRSDDVAAAGGSSEAFTDFSELVYSSEEVQIDRPVASGSNPVSAAYGFAKSSLGTASTLFAAASLDGPLWESWAQPIRWAILIMQLPLLLLFALEGAKVLSGFIPFT